MHAEAYPTRAQYPKMLEKVRKFKSQIVLISVLLAIAIVSFLTPSSDSVSIQPSQIINVESQNKPQQINDNTQIITNEWESLQSEESSSRSDEATMLKSVSWFDDIDLDELRNWDGQSYHKFSHWSYVSDDSWKLWIPRFIRHLNLKSGDHIFESGCGVGAVLHSIYEYMNRTIKVSGVDLSSVQIDGAQIVLKDALSRCGDECFVEKGDMRYLTSAKNETFDSVLCIGAIGYLTSLADVKIAVRELLRIAKPGAGMLISHMVEPGGRNIGSFNVFIPIKNFWVEYQNELGYEIVALQELHSWPSINDPSGRYAIWLQKL